MDKGFIILEDFPKEGNFILLDNLQYQHCMHVDHRDLSITLLDVPTTPGSIDSFAYQQMRFSNSSTFKLATLTSSNETKTLKELNCDK